MPDDPYLVRKKPRDAVFSVAREDNIPDDLADDFVRVAGLESGHSHYTKNGKVKVSPVDPKDGQRAVGFAQIKPATARSVGISDPYDEVENIRAGLRYFAKGGSDPVRRRIAYFSGTDSKSVKYYDRTGRIPKGGDFTGTSFEQYVKGTGGQQQQNDPYLVPKAQTPAEASQLTETTDDPYLVAKPTAKQPEAPQHTGRFGTTAAPIKQQRPTRRSRFEGVRAGMQGEQAKPLGVGELRRSIDFVCS